MLSVGSDHTADVIIKTRKSVYIPQPPKGTKWTWVEEVLTSPSSQAFRLRQEKWHDKIRIHNDRPRTTSIKHILNDVKIASCHLGLENFPPKSWPLADRRRERDLKNLREIVVGAIGFEPMTY